MTSLDLFRNVTELVSYQAGQEIFREGEVGEEMFLIKEGRVAISKGGNVVNQLQAGDMFGEMALISNERRSATAVAETDCKLLPVNEEKFLYLVQQTPYFSLHVMSILAERLRRHGA